MNWGGSCQFAAETRWRKDETEVDPVFIRLTTLREGSASQTIVETIDERRIHRPDMTDGHSFRMVPGGQWRRVRKALYVVRRDAAIGTAIHRTRDEIVLIVAAQEQLL